MSVCTPPSTHLLRWRTLPLLLLLAAVETAHACTLYAAHGSRVAGGGTLIVKVRDWSPGDLQVLERVTPPTGHAYYALVTEGKDPGVKAGINERGLVVVSATASTIPKPDRQASDHTTGLLRKLLAECASVDEVLAKNALFRGPRFLLVADASQVACIEIGPKGEVRVDVTRDGVAAHTNHYLPGALTGANQKAPGASSLSRFKRIQELLDSKTPHTLDGFLGFSRDQHAGPDLSIFRTGLKPTGTRTMSVWAVRLKPGGGADIVVRLLNAGKPELLIQRDAADIFRKMPVR